MRPPDDIIPLSSPMVVAQLRRRYPHVVEMTTVEGWVGFDVLLRIREARAWCVERFGVSATMTRESVEQVVVIDLNRAWASHGQTFLFDDANAAFEFKMRWV